MKKVENELHGIIILDPKQRKMFVADFLTGGVDHEVCDTATTIEVFDSLKPELSRVFGNYNWMLEGNNRDGWFLSAYYLLKDEVKSFIESKGQTAMEAFWNCDKIRMILK